MKRIFTSLILTAITVACHIELPQAPIARFTFTPESGCQAPCSVTFTSESENVAGVEWDFNDGSEHDFKSTTTHEFKSGKVYQVKLIATGIDGGSSGVTKSVTIGAAASSVPEAAFKYSITNDSIAPATVSFDNQSKNATKYQWNFGDPSSSGNTSTAQSPDHTYTNPGTYTVTLTATNEKGETSTKTSTVTIKAPAQTVNAISISGGPNYTTDIAVDANGNVYVCGRASGTVQFGNGISAESYAGSTDIFVAKYNSALQCQWAKIMGSDGEDHVNGIALDANNDIYITGFISGTLKDGGASVKGGMDGYIAKLGNASGDRKWIKTFGGPKTDMGRGLAYYPSNDKIYLTGYIEGESQTSNIDFGGKALSANGRDGFLAFVSSSGDLGTPITFGGADSQQPEDITVDNAGNAYITGGFQGTMTLPGIAQSLPGIGQADVFVLKWALNSSSFQWMKQTGSGSDEYVHDIILDTSGNVYITGMHNGNITDMQLPASSYEDVFLGKWNASGMLQKGKNGFNEAKPDYYGGLAVHPNGNIVLAGTFEDTGRFPMTTGTQKTGRGKTDILIAEVDKDLNATGFSTSDGGAGEDRVNRITIGLGNVYATGWFYGTSTFNGTTLNGISETTNTFIVRYKL